MECKAKGIFRKKGITPLAGDFVRLEEEAGAFVISEIFPRKNYFVRPPVANVDILVLVASTVEPTPSCLVLDRLAATAVYKGVQPVLVVTKTDLAGEKFLEEVYRGSGIPVLTTHGPGKGEALKALKKMLAGHICVFCGNSGVGKSTLLNALLPKAQAQTGGISKKLGRGRHTTREVQLYEAFGGLLADTPGFASLDMQRGGFIPKEELQYAFPEFEKHVPACRFTGCSHTGEKGCAVIRALEAGEISKSRYQSYLTMYQEARAVPEWEREKK
ncbi:MAG: ribosome small subunit-dependent GTPase A [Oscillospiraceae bacterium]|nr:ribosome small subunit-dependent GTPase A [Oscillospiraceae bacterium]